MSPSKLITNVFTLPERSILGRHPSEWLLDKVHSFWEKGPKASPLVSLLLKFALIIRLQNYILSSVCLLFSLWWTIFEVTNSSQTFYRKTKHLTESWRKFLSGRKCTEDEVLWYWNLGSLNLLEEIYLHSTIHVHTVTYKVVCLLTTPVWKKCCSVHVIWRLQQENNENIDIWFICAKSDFLRPITEVKWWLISQVPKFLQFLNNLFSVSVKHMWDSVLAIDIIRRKGFICWSRLNEQFTQKSLGK